MDWLLISESTPANVNTGRLWIKPSTAQAYLRMGSSWIPIASGGTPIVMGGITTIIDGIDKSSIVSNIEISDILNQEADTCSFILEDIDGSNKPLAGQEVIIFKGTELIFGGKITLVPQSIMAVQKYIYEVEAMDYTQDLNRAMVVNTYSSTTAGAIIRDFMATYVKDIGTYFVEDGLNVDSIAFNYMYPADCIQKLAELTGYSWYVDYERQLHFFDRLTNPAPYQLTDDYSDGEYKDLVIEIDRSQLINTQTIRGGFEFSNLYPQEQLADGTQTSFAFDYIPFSPISVYLNINGAGYGSAETLGIDNIDSGASYEFVYNANEKVIKNENHATLNNVDKIKLTYKYKKPILAKVRDKQSIEAIQKIEGGTGIYEAPIIIDDQIQTKEAAKERGNAELKQFSNPLITGTFTTLQHGYKSGQLLTVNIPSRNINNTYLIRSVTSTSLGHGVFNYEIEFATKLKGLTEYLMFLYDEAVGIFERTDENLHTFEEFGNTINIDEIISSTLLTNVSGNPSVYSNDEETTPDKGRYNLSQYG